MEHRNWKAGINPMCSSFQQKGEPNLLGLWPKKDND